MGLSVTPHNLFPFDEIIKLSAAKTLYAKWQEKEGGIEIIH